MIATANGVMCHIGGVGVERRTADTGSPRVFDNASDL
jgi:hypothetical protein